MLVFDRCQCVVICVVIMQPIIELNLLLNGSSNLFKTGGVGNDTLYSFLFCKKAKGKGMVLDIAPLDDAQ